MPRQVPQVQAVPKTGDFPSINQATKHAEIPQTHCVDKVVDLPVVLQRQVPRIQTVLNTMEVPSVPFVGIVMDVPVMMATKHVEIPQTYHIDHVADVPVVMLRQVPHIQNLVKTADAFRRESGGSDLIVIVLRCRLRHAHTRPEQDVKRLQLSVPSAQDGHDIGRVIDAQTMSSYGAAHAEIDEPLSLRGQSTTECQSWCPSMNAGYNVTAALRGHGHDVSLAEAYADLRVGTDVVVRGQLQAVMDSFSAFCNSHRVLHPSSTE